MAKSPDSFTFTVGKLDAGMAILLGERAHLIEFPSLLLPPGVTTGSIVNIAVHRNVAEEKRRDQEFWELQKDIFNTFGVESPKAPKLEIRNITQTSVTLEWPALQLATAKLRSLDIYRNGQRLSAIPSPLQNTSTKLSALEQNTEYTFQLVLRTTAGNFPSNVIRVRTHTMTDTSGISVCFGNVQDKRLLETAKEALAAMGARWSEKIQIETTHFVCTSPSAQSTGDESTGSPGPGVDYQRAQQLSIPVVHPQWILACHTEKKMVPIARYDINAAASSGTSISQTATRPQSMSQVSESRSPPAASTSPTNTAVKRASMPVNARVASREDVGDTFVGQTPQRTRITPQIVVEEETEDVTQQNFTNDRPGRSHQGIMNKNFRFPSPSPSSERSNLPPTQTNEPPSPKDTGSATVEVPPPPPVEKEKVTVELEGDDDVGETEEIPL